MKNIKFKISTIRESVLELNVRSLTIILYLWYELPSEN